MLNKNDPLVSAVQEVMKRNQAEREAARLVNEKFGIHDRKALPRERQSEWDSAYQAVLTEGAEALGEDYDPEKLRRSKEVEKRAKSLRTNRPEGIIKDFGNLIAKRGKDDAVTGADTAAASIKAMHQLYGKDKRWKNAIKKVTVDEESLDEKVKMTKQQFANLDGDPKFTANDLAHARKGTHVKKAAAGNLEEAGMMPKNRLIAKVVAGARARKASSEADFADKYFNPLHPVGKDIIKNATKNAETKKKVFKRLEEKKMTDAEMAKREEIVKSMKREMSGFKKRYGDRAKDVMYATATKQAMKEEKEGFNNRHGLSVTASAEKQAVADQLTERVGNPLLLNRAKARARLGDSGVRRPISGTNNLQTRLANMRRSDSALEPNRNIALDNPATQSPMATAQKRQDMASAARQNRAGTNTFVAAAKAEAQRRRQAGVAVTPVPSAAKAQSDEILGAARAANRNDLAQKAKDLRAGTNTFTKPKSSGAPTMAPGTKLNRPSGDYNPFMGKGEPKVDARAKGLAPIPSRPATGIGPQQAAMPAKPTPDAIKNLGRKSAVAPVSPAEREPPSVATKPATTSMTAQTTQTTQPAPAAQAPAPVKKVAPAPAPAAQAPAPKRTAFQDMMRRAQSKSDPAGTPGRRY